MPATVDLEALTTNISDVVTSRIAKLLDDMKLDIPVNKNIQNIKLELEQRMTQKDEEIKSIQAEVTKIQEVRCKVTKLEHVSETRHLGYETHLLELDNSIISQQTTITELRQTIGPASSELKCQRGQQPTPGPSKQTYAR